ncbi:FKBP12-associated protein [Pseudocyphellaria aurata]|nr:FKBP12-associated protein [Pseudocyphellaria aurata]
MYPEEGVDHGGMGPHEQTILRDMGILQSIKDLKITESMGRLPAGESLHGDQNQLLHHLNRQNLRVSKLQRCWLVRRPVRKCREGVEVLQDVDEVEEHELENPWAGGMTGSRPNSGRQFGSNLTTPAPADPISNSRSTLQGDAPEFHPGQPHTFRPKNPRGAKGNTDLQSFHAKEPRLRRDSGLKSTAPDIATRTHEDISNGSSIYPVLRSGQQMKVQPKPNNEIPKGTFLHLVNGDAQDVIYQKKLFQPRITAGVRRKPTHERYLGYHLIRVARRAANLGWCRKNVLIHANYCVTRDHALHAHILVLSRAASVAKGRRQEDALTLIMIRDGAAERFVGISCLAGNIPVKSPVMKVCAVLAKILKQSTFVLVFADANSSVAITLAQSFAIKALVEAVARPCSMKLAVIVGKPCFSLRLLVVLPHRLVGSTVSGQKLADILGYHIIAMEMRRNVRTVLSSEKSHHLKQEHKCNASKTSEGNSKKTLSCNDECARLARNRKLALALNIDPETHMNDHIPYSIETLRMFRENTKWSQSQEREFRVFAADETEKRLRFKAMPPHQRSFIHSLSEDFGLDSESMDPEPHRHVAVFKTPRFVNAPMKTLAECLRIRSAAEAVTTTSSETQKNVHFNNIPYNGFVLMQPRFGITLEEIRADCSSVLDATAGLAFDVSFLPSEEIVIKARPVTTATNISASSLEATLKALKTPLIAIASSKRLADVIQLCSLDSSLNIVRRQLDDAPINDGWSQVVAKAATPRSAPRQMAVGEKSVYTVLGSKVKDAKKKREESHKAKQEVVEDWEEEARKEEEATAEEETRAEGSG